MASNVSPGTGGLREAKTCEVCMDGYDQVLKIPLILPCGHTFCRSCLANLRTAGQVLCPRCRTQHNVQLEALTVIYSLINFTPVDIDLQVHDIKQTQDFVPKATKNPVGVPRNTSSNDDQTQTVFSHFRQQASQFLSSTKRRLDSLI